LMIASTFFMETVSLEPPRSCGTQNEGTSRGRATPAIAIPRSFSAVYVRNFFKWRVCCPYFVQAARFAT
jgi:hypothetical protein